MKAHIVSRDLHGREGEGAGGSGSEKRLGGGRGEVSARRGQKHGVGRQAGGGGKARRGGEGSRMRSCVLCVGLRLRRRGRCHCKEGGSVEQGNHCMWTLWYQGDHCQRGEKERGARAAGEEMVRVFCASKGSLPGIVFASRRLLGWVGKSSVDQNLLVRQDDKAYDGVSPVCFMAVRIRCAGRGSSLGERCLAFERLKWGLVGKYH